MHKIVGRTTAYLMIISLLIIAGYGCSANSVSADSSIPNTTLQHPYSEATPVVLKVLTESTMGGDGRNPLVVKKINQVISYYKSEHPNIDFVIETLPRAGENRENALQSRRVALLAGDVPDIYLLPTTSIDDVLLSIVNPKEYESLFRDPAQAQTNHWFLDISEFYNKDIDLHTEELQTSVMDAGKVGNARYILPLGYSLNLLLADQKALASSTVDLNSNDLIGSLLDLKQSEWLPDLRWEVMPLSLFPEICNYDSETNLIDKDEFIHFLKQLNQVYIGYGNSHDSNTSYLSNTWSGYITDRASPSTPFTEDIHIDWLDLPALLYSLPIMKSANEVPAIVPLRAKNGDLAANITYWGAIGAACENPSVAYDFLRLFLTPEVQHGGSLVNSSGKEYSMKFDVGYTPGWPVRYKGFAEARWNDFKCEIENTNGLADRKKALLKTSISDEDLPFLDEEITYARFPSVLDIEMYSALASMMEDKVSDNEIEKIADAFIRNLNYHLAEG